tara:strand:- start:31 stop:681 length:651 start_codon:yes stop_codon:yes gene_type:complete
MEQRSSEWFEARRGRFTASNISNILGGLDKKGELLKKTSGAIDTMAFEKAVEIAFGLDEEESFVSSDMQRGIDLEPFAFELIKNKKGLEFAEVEECSFYKIGENAGASPDGLIKTNSKVSAVLEIKCPKHIKFFKIVANGVDEIDRKYIAQMNMQMMATNTKECVFLNYLIFNNEEYSHEIVIKKDEELCKLIDERIEVAVKVRDEYVKQLKNNIQ